MSAVLEGKRIDRVRFEGASDRSGVSPLDSIIGESPVMRRLKEFLTRIGTSSAPVLIQGESGKGKEIVAQAIHQSNPKRTGAFIAENCATLPESLLESELERDLIIGPVSV
ncbi:MAG: sigma 54-interacting transcriptional regulator [Candidatus Latescibacterota bacterium]|jgi:two-component system response regulator PilR (NtrC family)